MQTQSDGDFHMMAIMEVATRMIFGMEMVDVGDPEISETQSRELFTTSEKQAGSLPRRLFIASAQNAPQLSAVAEAMGIAVERISSEELASATQDAREGFAKHVSGGRMQ